ncbi:hypothetical protein SERLA73DRAFT_157456 [Serpula lacrymans var. lacrymans S7.3]|uniref:Retrotransposon gag domain-containing protein n=1 Tax=Serpula lacrymans var. lacrymans (strain S7.3) TaxID=936435 RepID=F8QJ42_SERL3|nr:hypothetical protein SERLA73DRAFT_157456 [Serpula lacrymans var. lacrymans S7.3]
MHWPGLEPGTPAFVVRLNSLTQWSWPYGLDPMTSFGHCLHQLYRLALITLSHVKCKKSHWAPGLQGEGDWLGLGISQIADSINLTTRRDTGKPPVEKKFNKKVEVVADPGAFEGDRAQFAEWWIKLQIWVKANWDAFADDFEVATAVLSRLKGPVAGRYAQVRLQECYTAGVWPTWDDLKIEIEKYFKPQAERDWARQQICSFKQGNMRTDDFVTRFLALSIQGGLGNEHAVELLERNKYVLV